MLQHFMTRVIASRSFKWIISFAGALYLTKELFHPVWDLFLENVFHHSAQSIGSHRFFYKFVGTLIYFGVFYVITIIVVSLSHADEYLRVLTLKIIRERESFLVFMRAFILQRSKSQKTFRIPLRFLHEIDDLLERGQRQLGLHHKRSLAFLLGINYVEVKRALQGLDEAFGESNATRDGIRDASGLKAYHLKLIEATRDALNRHLFRPLKDLSIHDLRTLLFMLKLGVQPSYDKAVSTFVLGLSNRVHHLADLANKRFQPPDYYNGVMSEANRLLTLYKDRTKVRLGYPLFSFVDYLQNNALSRETEVINTLATSSDPARRESDLRQSLHNINRILYDATLKKDESIKKFSEMLQTSPHHFDRERDLICLYGFSGTVFEFLKQSVVTESEKRQIEIILIRTEGAATTNCEEHAARDELLESGFSNLTLQSIQDLLVRTCYVKRINFLLGLEVVNNQTHKAVFHYGAGQRLQSLITELENKGTANNSLRVFLLGAAYKDVLFEIEDPEVQHSSLFDFTNEHYIWVNEHWQGWARP